MVFLVQEMIHIDIARQVALSAYVEWKEWSLQL